MVSYFLFSPGKFKFGRKYTYWNSGKNTFLNAVFQAKHGKKSETKTANVFEIIGIFLW
jgi:hypothetical protein